MRFLFPYPLISKQNKNSLNKLDPKKMYLVNLKFYEGLVINKRLFYLFVTQLFSTSNSYVKDSLRPMCKEPELVCTQTQVYKYSKVKNLNPYKILKIYNFLLENIEISLLDECFGKDNYLVRNESLKKPTNNRKQEIKLLKSMNQNFSGQLILPRNEENFNKKDKN